MIEVAPTTAIMIYLALTLGVILGLWALRHYQTRNKKNVIERQALQVCEYCHYAYLSDLAEKFSKCPSCHSLNETTGHTE